MRLEGWGEDSVSSAFAEQREGSGGREAGSCSSHDCKVRSIENTRSSHVCSVLPGALYMFSSETFDTYLPSGYHRIWIARHIEVLTNAASIRDIAATVSLRS